MTPEVREALESAAEVLHQALVAYAKDAATLDYVLSETGEAYCCVNVDGQLLLTVIDPPINVGSPATAQ